MLEVNGLSHSYRTGTHVNAAVSNLSFTVYAGQLACIVGPSGCGKSTLLRCVGGLLEPSSGTVRLHGELVSGVPDDVAVVFQDYSRSLFPWLSVRRNMEFPLRWRNLSRAQRRERAAEALSWVGLSDVGDQYPWQLSGGMQQRVSIARALASQPTLLLMDEPFASVDAQTRFELEDLLRRVQNDHGSTVLLVTHDIDESVYLGDRVLVLSHSPRPSSPISPSTCRPSEIRSAPGSRPSSSRYAPRSPACYTAAHPTRSADDRHAPVGSELAPS